MNRFEKILFSVAPQWGLHRMSARMQADALRAYEAAAKTNRTSTWHDSNGSANAEASASLVTLRTRARELARNNAYAKRAIEVIATNTVGSGIRPSHMGVSATQLKRVKQVWNDWAETKACDANGMMDIYAMQKHVMHAVARDGECLILKKVNTDPNAAVPFQLQVLEADYLDSEMYRTLDVEKGNYVMQGVEYNQQGKRVAYWLYESHPGDPRIMMRNFQPKRVPAEYVAHIYVADRPGQVRGIPFGVASFIKLRDFEEYQDAELVRRKVASLMVAFVSDPAGSTIGGSKKKFPSTMNPGSIMELNGGQQVTLSTPPSVDGYGEYSRVTLQAVATAYGVTYEAMTGNLSDVNFSSGRMGWLEFHRNVTDWQYNLIVPMMCDVIYDWFKQGIAITGAARVPSKASWTAPRREMIDPLKEAQGIKEQIRIGLISRSEAIRMQGYEPDDVHAEMIEDAKKLDDAKLMLDSDPRFDAGRKSDNAPTDTQKPPMKPNNQ
jgi:lambda family phage portal protein